MNDPNQMNDPMIIAAALVLVIAGIGSAIVQVINARAAAEDRREAKATRIKLEREAEIASIKADRIVEQGVAIHTLTNSNLSAVTAALAAAIAKNEVLERIITAQDKAKDIADTVSLTQTAKVEPKVLDELIEIKENTANTVDSVKELKKTK